MAPTPLAQRRVGDRGLELADDLGGATRRKQRIGPLFHQRGVAFNPARLLGCTARAVGQFGDAAPERQRLVEPGQRLPGVAGGDRVAAQPRGRLVASGVNLGRAQRPAGPLGQDEAVAKGATQGGDVGLQSLGGGAWRIVAPEEFHEGVGRHDGTARAARAL